MGSLVGDVGGLIGWRFGWAHWLEMWVGSLAGDVSGLVGLRCGDSLVGDVVVYWLEM